MVGGETMNFNTVARIAIICAFIGLTDARAADWDNTDRALFGGFVALQVADGLQTNEIRKHPDRFRETNRLYGDPPQMGRVLAVKAVATGALYWLVRDMPGVDRKVLLGALDAVYVGIVAHNYTVGIRIGF